MKTSTAMTFEVSDVVRATEALPEVPYKEAVEALLAPGGDEELEEPEWDEDDEDAAFSDPEPAPPRPVEACARYHGRLVGHVRFHPFVAAVHRAFVDHRPLCLSPDMVWLLICQGVANHVNARSDDLRPRLVRHQGKAVVIVRRDDFMKGSPENPWPEVFAEFSATIRRHVGPAIDRFVPDFTTTGAVERAAADVVLLDAVQSYFAYEFHTRCGIPAITLEGTCGDWDRVAERARSFADLDLEWWTGPLGGVLEQFRRASRGDVDRPFWQSIYKLHDESGGPKVTGWIATLFPYLTEWRAGIATERNPWVRAEHGEHHRSRADGPTLEQFPGGLSAAPFRWQYFDRSFDMEFLGGFVGVSQDPDTLAVRPEIGWAVREAGAVTA